MRSPPAGENDPKNPETPYERSKLAGEIRVTQRAEQTGLDVVVLRPAWVYGPGCPRTEKLLRAISRKRFFYIGDGSNLRHPVHIADTVTAFKLAAMSPPAVGSRVYNIAGPQPLPLRRMIEEFARIIGVSAPRLAIPRSIGWLAGLATEKAFGVLRREPPFSRRSLAFFMNDNAFSTAAAERELGFRPEVGFEEGLRRTIAEVHQP